MHVGPILLNGNVSIGENFSVHINTGLVAGGLVIKHLNWEMVLLWVLVLLLLVVSK